MINMPFNTYSDDNKTKSKVSNESYWKFICNKIISTEIKVAKYNLNKVFHLETCFLSIGRFLFQIAAFIDI